MQLQSLNINDLTHHVTANFSFEEFFKSATADARKIQNFPSTITNLSAVCGNVSKLAYLLQQVRELNSAPVRVNSGYRCVRLNTAVGGKSNSLHLLGAAVDIVSSNMSRLQTCLEYVQSKTRIPSIAERNGQLFRIVPENGWFHIQLESVAQRLSLEDFINYVSAS